LDKAGWSKSLNTNALKTAAKIFFDAESSSKAAIGRAAVSSSVKEQKEQKVPKNTAKEKVPKNLAEDQKVKGDKGEKRSRQDPAFPEFSMEDVENAAKRICEEGISVGNAIFNSQECQDFLRELDQNPLFSCDTPEIFSDEK